MGIVNVTPDSFSDGGRFLATDDAVAHGHELIAQGADLLDIGGESTRPGATRPLVGDELARVVPVIETLAAEGATLSVDTMRPEVAAAALKAGAQIINDVSGGLADPEILKVAAEHDATYVVMHWRAHGAEMQHEDHLVYADGVVATVKQELEQRIEAARAAGIPDDNIVIDPGLGFSKTADDNWRLLAGVEEFHKLGFPVLIGASRKTFLGHLLAAPDGTLRPVDERESAHDAITVFLAQRGVWATRTHDVRAAADALKAATKLETIGARSSGELARPPAPSEGVTERSEETIR
ncbi:dihydropteroate synthase [Nocardioides albertanoniae]|uniref:Dihydropteroate synthase n=1 Tax=Nocardioides albertanoniae TaxID=1175486 RepID=A0A543A298_9ACTN|nr:dihydropteroate synthase [Nocardioides albertanoniae]TQL66586.1 dihydropteroate synthase [Nocardioides albertanoniae]